ncbi:8-oxo-dGTP diphosphatase [Aerococcus viridans]|uniref:DNA mismatch repair protein MutT n=2 Tax=Aerococcus viridans TaxID=1377 RepID=A0AAU8U5Q4_9LACT|nr:NUDIX domain-containing protein [Aerococcus viridans]AMC01501.1 DNA mismatch repair protein MutT [Aerococcus viridans]EFG49329.1 putative mutator MutT protein [Aerococcus viridans ATCC 11563 = CCUG 4311]SUU14851.1 8-oxo-dGTP diphosphatase [Aerococcus viridans]
MLSTLIYLENDLDQYLMLHRTKKANDVNHGKWIGIGGKFEHGESPMECLEREVKEEAGQKLKAAVFRGIVTFIYADQEPMYIFLYTGQLENNEVGQTREGDLAWVDKDKIFDLTLWEGDRIFLKELIGSSTLMDIKLVYDENDILKLVEKR